MKASLYIMVAFATFLAACSKPTKNTDYSDDPKTVEALKTLKPLEGSGAQKLIEYSRMLISEKFPNVKKDHLILTNYLYQILNPTDRYPMTETASVNFFDSDSMPDRHAMKPGIEYSYTAYWTEFDFKRADKTASISVHTSPGKYISPK